MQWVRREWRGPEDTEGSRGRGELRSAGRHRGGAGGRQLREEARGPPPGAARAASAFLAVGVTSAADACAPPTLSASAESARNCVASGVFSHLPPPPGAPSLPAKQQVRSWRGARILEPVDTDKAHTSPLTFGYPGHPERTRAQLRGPTAPRPPGCKHFTPRGHPSGTELPSLPTAIARPNIVPPPPFRRGKIFIHQGIPRKKQS